MNRSIYLGWRTSNNSKWTREKQRWLIMARIEQNQRNVGQLFFQDGKPVAGRPEISGGHLVNKQLLLKPLKDKQKIDVTIHPHYYN